VRELQQCSYQHLHPSFCCRLSRLLTLPHVSPRPISVLPHTLCQSGAVGNVTVTLAALAGLSDASITVRLAPLSPWALSLGWSVASLRAILRLPGACAAVSACGVGRARGQTGYQQLPMVVVVVVGGNCGGNGAR
jgi:hypothetical protein